MPATERYYLNVIEGLEPIAAAEVEELGLGATISGPGHVDVEQVRDPEPLLNLRTVEDVFASLFAAGDMSRSRNELGRIHRAVASGAGFERALAALRQSKRIPRRPFFRVVAQMNGRHNFSRADLGEAVGNAIAHRFGDRWVPVQSGAHVEVWVELDGSDCRVGLRLSDRTMRHRAYKSEHIAASLRPTVAAAMVRMTRPQDDDVFLDPMCGAGTLLIERGEAGRYRLLLGGDSNPEAVAAAKANIGNLYKPIEVRRWDATRLPLDAGAVSAVAVNPPFGRKVGTGAPLGPLYSGLLTELARVTAPGARLVILTDQTRLVQNALRGLPFVRGKSLRIRLLGHWATIQVLGRLR